VAAGVLVFSALAAPLFAGAGEVSAVAALARDAERVFRGRCLAAREVAVAVGGAVIPATGYTFAVLDPLQGDLGERVTFRQVGSPAGGADDLGELAGLPRYEPGSEYVLFLLPESAAGLTSPAGAAEGAFSLAGEEAVQLLPAHALPLARGAAEPPAAAGTGAGDEHPALARTSPGDLPMPPAAAGTGVGDEHPALARTSPGGLPMPPAAAGTGAGARAGLRLPYAELRRAVVGETGP
jgi:hypothetical protein